MNLEIKALYNASTRYILRLPHYCDAADVTMTVTTTTGAEVSQAITAAASDALTVTDASADRRTLTLDASTAAPSGMVGEDGGYAMWHDAQLGELPVRVRERATATSIILADPLPGRATTGTLRFNVLSTLFTAASGVTAVVGRCSFRVAYAWDVPGAVPSQQGVLSGLLHVVKHPFSTGVTSDSLRTFHPSIASQMPVGQGSYARAIDASERVLWRWIRADLQGRPEGYRTEDALSGSALHEVHALLAIAHVLRAQEMAGGREGRAEAAEERARALYEQVMKSIPWMDGNGDDVVDAGEADVSVSGSSAVVSGLFSGDSDFLDASGATYSRRFKARSDH